MKITLILSGATLSPLHALSTRVTQMPTISSASLLHFSAAPSASLPISATRLIARLATRFTLFEHLRSEASPVAQRNLGCAADLTNGFASGARATALLAPVERLAAVTEVGRRRPGVLLEGLPRAVLAAGATTGAALSIYPIALTALGENTYAHNVAGEQQPRTSGGGFSGPETPFATRLTAGVVAGAAAGTAACILRPVTSVTLARVLAPIVITNAMGWALALATYDASMASLETAREAATAQAAHRRRNRNSRSTRRGSGPLI